MAQSDQEQSRESSQETVGLGITIPGEVMASQRSWILRFQEDLPSEIFSFLQSSVLKKNPKESHYTVQTKNPIYSSEMLNRTIEGAIILY